ncbi:MAG TPA: rhodanese-like domain-containing protein [Burkholderiales bacterium]|nr:rhodanese-like domain-containing protein [Burkholderiales bacterium]
MKAIDVGSLREKLAGEGELALLDAREQGVHYRGHPFFASSAPLSRLELLIDDLVPRRGAPIVFFDGGDEGLAQRAAARLQALGYSDVSVLEGGCAAWQAAGGELFSGVNVPSKAFGEFVEHQYDTPRIAPEDLKKMLDAKARLVILDSRPLEEYRRMCIPGGIDVPGAELVWRARELAADPQTLVVVNCAGRTRSIIGCQSLRNAGIPNRVVALKDGTMGWELAGYTAERGAARFAPAPSESTRSWARQAADGIASRFGVRTVEPATVREWQRDESRTLYLLDVRTREEFEAGHLAGSRHAPGGQLVQAGDEYVGVRNARVVLIDPERVRAVMTASWLNQMGWNDVHVLDRLDGFALEHGPRARRVLGLQEWQTVREPEGAVLDFSTSLGFRERHIPGAWWVVRSRLEEAEARIPGDALTLTSENAVLAHLAAPEVAKIWKNAKVRVLEGGNAAWFSRGGAQESGVERATTTMDDVSYKPYDHAADYEKHARDYLSWEVALVEQIKREPAVRFRTYQRG